MLVLYELWAGERLVLEKASPRYRRPRRPISVSAGPGIDIWRSCRFTGALVRSLCTLLGGIGRFVACTTGSNHCRLRHIGWEKSGHGLTSRPSETASEAFLNELLLLCRYPRRSAPALLGGAVPLRYCASRFASKVPTWRLPTEGVLPTSSPGLVMMLALMRFHQVVLELTGLAGLVGVATKQKKLQHTSYSGWFWDPKEEASGSAGRVFKTGRVPDLHDV